MYTYHVIIGKM